jgi:hypothetical protein
VGEPDHSKGLMRLARLSRAALVVCGTAVARAEVPADACTPDFEVLLSETKSECEQLNEAKRQRQLLVQSEQDRRANAVRIAELDALIANLETARPLLKKGLCGATPPTCDVLASILTSGLDESSVQALDVATRAAAAPADALVAREAAASDRQTSNNKSGSSGQIDAVEAIQPITLAGGAIGLSGTRSGTKGVGTITVNPLALMAPDDPTLGRLLDLALSAPFDLDQGSQGRQTISVRVRANLMAPISAKALEDEVDTWLRAAGRYADDLEKVLAHAVSVRRCAEYVASTNKVSKDACEQELDSDELRDSRRQAYERIAALSRAADRYYLGLDLRLDTGDPTGDAVVGDDGTHLLGGIGAGTRISQGERWDWELRGRAAGDYFKSRDDGVIPRPDPVFSFDWGAAFILSGRLEPKTKQRMAFGVGVEGRHAGGDSVDAGRTPTNYANLNLMTVVPALNGGDLGLAISIPLAEEGVKRGTVISFSTDLGLLDHSAD